MRIPIFHLFFAALKCSCNYH